MTAEAGPHGWLVIDKAPGMTSNRVVETIRRCTGVKVGHAGTLDPLATGVLPIAIGEATKTTAYAMAGAKRYRFRIRWGVGRATDDREGDITAESDVRPTQEAIAAMLPRFTGSIEQQPPAYSAIKINGRRSYELARTARLPILAARMVEVSELRLIGMPDRDHADYDALVGKGTYIRALARDLGAALGTCAHLAELRRLSVGRFTESQAITLDSLAEHGHIDENYESLLPIETALADLPAVMVTEGGAARLRSGRRIMANAEVSSAGSDRPREGAIVSAWHGGAVIALARIEEGHLRPVRVFNR
jgi:tRNA pseudouridine55 synthase